jgi:hypothetical protein
MRPEDGRSAILAAARAVSAMRLGRLDDGDSSANVGTIEGGSWMNVVPERCAIVAEVRSLSDERAEALVAEMVDRVHEAANVPECECDVEVNVQRTFAGYRVAASSPAVRVAETTLSACGFEPRRVSSGGASDANALIAQGVEVVNLANGTERNHEPGERVSVRALEDMLDVALALLEGASAHAFPLNAGLHAQEGGRARRSNMREHSGHASDPGQRAMPSARSSSSSSTSSPTSSSSAGCRATRSRRTAQTCCSSARSSILAKWACSRRRTRTSRRFCPSSRAAGRRGNGRTE